MHSKSYRSKKRLNRGSSIAELPVVIWLVLFVFLFPLMDIATMGLRICFLYAATHNACISSARARTFLTSTDTHPPAVQLAQTGANAVLNAFSGVHIISLTPEIITTDVNTLKQTISTTPLTVPPDTSNNTYQIQIKVTGTVDPFISVYFPVAVPGINEPLSLTFSDAQFFENPAGLTL